MQRGVSTRLAITSHIDDVTIIGHLDPICSRDQANLGFIEGNARGKGEGVVSGNCEENGRGFKGSGGCGYTDSWPIYQYQIK